MATQRANAPLYPRYLQVIAAIGRVDGRLARYDFWLRMLAQGVVALTALTMFGFADGVTTTGLLCGLSGLILLAIAMAGTISTIVRRLHDRNRTGWWLLLAMLLLPGLNSPGRGWDILQIVFAIWLFIEVGLRPGTRGPNRYGDPA